MVNVYVSCILKQSDKMNKQKHIVDVKKSSLVSRFITTCLTVADRRGDKSFATLTENLCLDTFKT